VIGWLAGGKKKEEEANRPIASGTSPINRLLIGNERHPPRRAKRKDDGNGSWLADRNDLLSLSRPSGVFPFSIPF
jgi:hypothetical protein